MTSEGHDLDGYTIPQRVDDLEDARRLLSYGKINLFSESAGTRTAQIYTFRYPASIHRSVQLAVNAPGRFLYRPELTDAQLNRLCAAAATARPVSRRRPSAGARSRSSRETSVSRPSSA